MSEIYNFEYYHNYCGPIPYENTDVWTEHFGRCADRIITELHPSTVLDAGCAMGYLVAALRDRGVEAYGIDISEYAISKVREDIRPYCFVGSLTEALPPELPKRFDLVTNIEVLEHLYEEDGEVAIENLCKVTGEILFSSSPDDLTEATHVNVQQPEYWAKQFAKYCFYHQVGYRAPYVSLHAMLFRKMENMPRVVEDYERNIRMTEARYATDAKEWSKAVEDRDRQIQDRDNLMAERETAYQAALAHYKTHHLAAMNQCEYLTRQLAEVQNAYNIISNATCWKMTKPLRAVVDFAKRLLLSNRYTRLFYKGLKCLKENGVRYTWKKVKDKLRHRQEFLMLAARPLYSQEELDAQRTYTFPRAIKLSVVVPLYNTPKEFLHEMIRSVLDQTYGDWELCMADGSDQEHTYVGQICQEYARKDKRVIYRKLESNKGISENTNACIDMAGGDYIGLLDHDDLLHPAALYDVMRAICEQDADFVYTDEATFESPKASKIITAHFKPDFAIDNLRANNYICHFTVFRKTLLDSTGRFRSAYDGSQDHDIILRLTAQAKKIVHIPKLLYYWRSHPQSVAMDISSKGYAATAGKNAVLDSITQHGLQAEVDHSKAFPAIYRLKYAIKDSAKVSIIITVERFTNDLKRCIDSIVMRSTYKNYEIIVADNSSGAAGDLSYYDFLKADGRMKQIHLGREHNGVSSCEAGAAKATGEYLVFLHPDTEVITPEWIEEMLMYVQRDDVAAAGAMLYFPDDTIQHAGIVLNRGADHVAGNLCYNFPRGDIGYMGRLCYAQNMSAVSTACMMVKTSAYREVGGFDKDFTDMYCAVDFCLKLRKAGYLIVWTPYAELYHHEQKGNKKYQWGLNKYIKEETLRFQDRWNEVLAMGDPYYNPNFASDREDFSVR